MVQLSHVLEVEVCEGGMELPGARSEDRLQAHCSPLNYPADSMHSRAGELIRVWRSWRLPEICLTGKRKKGSFSVLSQGPSMSKTGLGNLAALGSGLYRGEPSSAPLERQGSLGWPTRVEARDTETAVLWVPWRKLRGAVVL